MINKSQDGSESMFTGKYLLDEYSRIRDFSLVEIEIHWYYHVMLKYTHSQYIY